MIDHMSLRVHEVEKSKDFYCAALKSIGYHVAMEFEIPGRGKMYGLGEGQKPDFWLAPHEEKHPAPTGQHMCFLAKTRAQVDAFHSAALAAGARDDGPPGIRAMYHPSYYGAFVVDLNGIHLEVCKHAPE